MTWTADDHNKLVARLVHDAVSLPMEAGGTERDVLVVLESVLAGVVLGVTILGGDEVVLDKVVEAAKARMAAIRLAGLPTVGSG